MKKIFAIALALVMVLSMASAFAFCTTGFDWSCATDTCEYGKAKIEVVPFVRGNSACATENTFTASTCAAVVAGERVYFAYKLTVDADLNDEWYASAVDNKVAVTYKNLCTDVDLTAEQSDNTFKLPEFDDADNDGKGGVYWFTTKGWVEDDDFSSSDVFELWAKKNDVKICATLKAKNEFKSATVNGYTVTKDPDTANILMFEKDGKKVQVEVNSDDKIVAFKVIAGGTIWYTVKTYNNDFTKFYAEGGTELDWTCNDAGKFLKAVMDEFKLSFGTCITEKAINANFGWDDEIESCFVWSKNASAIVDADCVVAIPKTGDVSVVAYAVMAVVAAAGTMLKK